MAEDSFIKYIRNADAVLQRFGIWPSFHDAEILRLELSRAEEYPTMTIDLYTYRVSPDPSLASSVNIVDEVVLTVRFLNVFDLELNGFNEQNVIATMSFRSTSAGLNVKLSPLYGVRAEFACDVAEVIGVTSHVKHRAGLSNTPSHVDSDPGD